VSYANSSGSARTFDFIDVLPFNGDGRVPNTDFVGTYSLSAIDLSRSPGITAVYVTSEPTSSLSNDPNSNVPTGTGIWSCLYGQMGTVGCPTAATVTGIRFVTSSLAVNAFQTVRISIDTDGNVGRDVYTNNAGGRASGLTGLIRSEDVSFTTSVLRIGNRIFDDRNNNGVYDVGDVALSGVTVELRDLGIDAIAYNSDDSILTSATTNAQGQYLLTVPENGNYYVRIASADLALGGIIQYFTAQKDGNSVDNFDADENINHDAIARNISTIRTPVFNINEGTEPTSEIDETFSLDSSSNLTADFGLVRPVTLGNLVWRDRNKNGIQDENEEGISGVAIKATWFGPDGVLGGSDDFEFTTTSSSNGEWQVTGPAGRYRIEFLAPNGYTVTIPDVGIDSGDSDQNGISESLNAGDSNFSFDFGFYTPEDSEKVKSDSEKKLLSSGTLSNTGSSSGANLIGLSFIVIVAGGILLALARRKHRIDSLQ